MNHRACVVCGTAAPTPQFRKDGHDMVACSACGDPGKPRDVSFDPPAKTPATA